MIDRKKVVAHAQHASGLWYERMRPAYRVLHLILVFSFLTLALTGLPLRYHDAGWSGVIYSILGGPDSVRFLHRFAGVVTFGYFFGYLTHIIRRWRKGEKEWAALRHWRDRLPVLALRSRFPRKKSRKGCVCFLKMISGGRGATSRR